MRYSQNANGVFIDMNDVDNTLLHELENYVSFAQNHPSNIDNKDIQYIINEETQSIPQLHGGICEPTAIGVQNNLEPTKDVLLEKEKQSRQNKKNENKFIAAKKKYSKQVLTETKDI